MPRAAGGTFPTRWQTPAPRRSEVGIRARVQSLFDPAHDGPECHRAHQVEAQLERQQPEVFGQDIQLCPIRQNFLLAS